MIPQLRLLLKHLLTDHTLVEVPRACFLIHCVIQLEGALRILRLPSIPSLAPTCVTPVGIFPRSSSSRRSFASF